MENTTVEFGVQLAASAVLVLTTTVIHAIGLLLISKGLKLENKRLDELSFDWRVLMLMCGMLSSLFLLHMVEISVFALFYWSVGAISSMELALAYSASAYATLGLTTENFPDDWRLMGAIEAVIGFLMIGWSTGFIVSKSNHIMP